MKAITFVVGLLAAQADEARLQALIAQLDGLGEGCTTSEFLERPALMELLACADAAVPALARALESSPRWSIRASAAYALGVGRLHDDPVSPLKFPWDRLLEDPHPVVRAVAAQVSRSAKAREVLGALEATHPLVLPLDTADWLHEDYYRRRLSRLLERSRSVKLFEEAPDWPDLLNARMEPDADVVTRILVSELRSSRRGHEVAHALVDAAFRQPSDDALRLGFLLHLAGGIPVHRDASHPDRPCPVALEFYEPLLALISRTAWTAREPYLLSRILSALVQLGSAGFEPALQLLERLSRDHVLEAVRAKSAWFLNDLADLRRSAEFHRKVEELRRQELRREPPPKPSGPGPAVPLPPESVPPLPTPGSGVPAAGIVAAVAVLIAVAVLLRRRRRI